MRPLVVIGSSNVDFIMRVGALPERGETVTDGEFMQTFGGKGANQAVAAARAGVPTTFISCVGNDPYAPILMENLHRDGLNLEGFRRVDDQPSGTALVMVGAGGMNYLTVAPGSNYALTPPDIRERHSLITSAGCLLLQMEIPVETNYEAIRIAKEAGIPVVLNYAPAKIHDVGLLRDLDTLVVNENEALALAGIEPTDPSSAQACAETLLAFGPSRVLLTLGRRGCMLLGKENERVDCPAFEVVALDTTAAGDTFCGALCAALMEKRPVADALRFASAAAAISVTRLGAQSSIPFRPSIEAFLASR